MNFYQFEFSLKIPGGLRGTAGRRLGTFNKALISIVTDRLVKRDELVILRCLIKLQCAVK